MFSSCKKHPKLISRWVRVSQKHPGTVWWWVSITSPPSPWSLHLCPGGLASPVVLSQPPQKTLQILGDPGKASANWNADMRHVPNPWPHRAASVALTRLVTEPARLGCWKHYRIWLQNSAFMSPAAALQALWEAKHSAFKIQDLKHCRFFFFLMHLQ